MSDIQMIYEYIHVTYGWHTNNCKWDTDDIRVHTNNMPSHTNTYEWRKDDVRVHTSYIKMVYDWHANNIRNIKPYKRFGAFRS